MSKKYGIPYMGSKSQICEPLCEYMFSRHSNKRYFIDAFCGGFSISHYALENSNLIVYANDYWKGLIAFYEDMLINGKWEQLKSEYVYKWLSRDRYHEIREEVIKDNSSPLGAVLTIVWSFGNNPMKNYLFGTNIEIQKQLLHNLLVWNEDKLDTYATNRLQNEKGEEIEKIKQDLAQIRYWYNEILPNNIKKMEYKSKYSNVDKRLKFMGSFKNYINIDKRHVELQQLQQLERLQQLEQLERLQQLEQLQQLERLERLQQLERLQRRIFLQSMDAVDFLNSLPQEILQNAIVYLDPPYKNTAKYALYGTKENSKDISINNQIKEQALSHKDICPVYISDYQKYEDMEQCFFVKKICNMKSNSEGKRTINNETLSYNGYKEKCESIGDLLGIWSTYE